MSERAREVGRREREDERSRRGGRGPGAEAAREAVQRDEREREREDDERVVRGEESRRAPEQSAREAVRERQRVRVQRAALGRPEPVGLPERAPAPQDAVDVVEIPEVLPRVPAADDGMRPRRPRPEDEERQRRAGESGDERLAPEAESGPLDRHGGDDLASSVTIGA